MDTTNPDVLAPVDLEKLKDRHAATARIRPLSPPLNHRCYCDGVALDCVGCITNWAVCDLPAVDAYAHIVEFGEPVETNNLKISSGDLLHGDCHGVLIIPLSIAAKIPAEADKMVREEREFVQFRPVPALLAPGVVAADPKNERQLRFSVARRRIDL
jgi:hypothetical protein